MTDNEVMITVTGSGELTAEGDSVVTRSRGRFFKKNGKIYLLYELPDENEKDLIIKHTVIIRETSMEVKKSGGGMETRIVYAPGVSHETKYATPFGDINLTFVTKSLEVDENDENLTVNVLYDIAMGEEVISKNRLAMEVSCL